MIEFDLVEGADYGEDLYPDAYAPPKKKKTKIQPPQKKEELPPVQLPLQEHEWISRP